MRTAQSRLLGLCLSLLLAAPVACEDPDPESGILVNVQLQSTDFEVDEIELWGYPDGRLFDERTDTLTAGGAALGQSFNLFVWVPPEWIDETIWLNVVGRNDGVITSHGQTSVVPAKGRIQEATIILIQGAPPCGNAVIDAGEECDGTALAGQTCENVLGLPDGQLSCEDCTLDTSTCHDCGDGEIEPGAEECDGANLAGETCRSQGFATGELRCNADCRLDRSLCEQGCGNNVIEPPESCDGTDLAGWGCPDFGYQRGRLACGADCEYDTSACEGNCGDGLQDPGEACDGAAFGAQTCLTAAGRESGALLCTAECHLDVSGCHTCGDGALEGPEQCDGINLGGEDCLSLTGLGAGVLWCDASCAFDTSDCHAP